MSTRCSAQASATTMTARCCVGCDTGLRSQVSTMRMRAMGSEHIMVLLPVMARSHGTGAFDPAALAACGQGVVLEPGALIFHPENVEIADDVYIGHYAILKGYYRNK